MHVKRSRLAIDIGHWTDDVITTLRTQVLLHCNSFIVLIQAPVSFNLFVAACLLSRDVNYTTDFVLLLLIRSRAFFVIVSSAWPLCITALVAMRAHI